MICHGYAAGILMRFYFDVNHHIVGAVANSAWKRIFPVVRVINGDPRHSDHRPIIIDVGTRERRGWAEQMESLPKFEARWLEEEDCMALWRKHGSWPWQKVIQP